MNQDDREKTAVSWVADLIRERDEHRIRLYGALWMLVDDEVISQSKACELANCTAQQFADEIKRASGVDIDERGCSAGVGSRGADTRRDETTSRATTDVDVAESQGASAGGEATHDEQRGGK